MNLFYASNKLSVLLQQKRAKVDSMEKDAAFRISLHITPTTFYKIERNQKLREDIRKLKIDCLCLSAEVDMYGGHYRLGDTDLKPVRAKPTEDNPPPIPPRPKAPQRPALYGPLELRVPPPPAPYRISRPSQLIPPERPSTMVSMHVERSISRRDDTDSECCVLVCLDMFNRKMHVQTGNTKWRCSLCQFDNHPDLKICEMCESSCKSYNASLAPVGGNIPLMHHVVPFFDGRININYFITNHNYNNNYGDPHSFPHSLNQSKGFQSSHSDPRHEINANHVTNDYETCNMNFVSQERITAPQVISCLSPSSCSSHSKCYCHGSCP